MPYTYKALRVKQRRGASCFYLLSVPAPELLEWCDVPRAKGAYMAGYQRTLSPKRTASLTEYLAKSESNVVPGAVIVATDIDNTKVTPFNDGMFCDIEILEDTRSFEQKLQELWGAFTTRLSADELSSANIDFNNNADDIDDDEPEEAEYPSSYLASLAQELTQAVQDWDKLEPDRQNAIRDYIEGVSKPGLIIDGQHRVFGAKNYSQEDVVLPIVLMPGLDYAEQVFQFYVLNSKARPLKPTELRRIVSTSLSNQEIEQLYKRFKQAGVDAEEARWTYEMNTRADSPFQGRIDFGYGEPGAVIKENVADQLVRQFMKMPHRRYSQLVEPLGDRWDDSEKRLEVFFWLWNAVRKHYEATWQEAARRADAGQLPQLFMKVALLTLQRFLLDRFVTALPYRDSAAAAPLSSQHEVEKMVASTLENLPGEFFDREWKLKQIDTTEGRKALYETMEQVWNNQGRMHGKQKLFAG